VRCAVLRALNVTLPQSRRAGAFVRIRLPPHAGWRAGWRAVVFSKWKERGWPGVPL